MAEHRVDGAVMIRVSPFSVVQQTPSLAGLSGRSRGSLLLVCRRYTGW